MSEIALHIHDTSPARIVKVTALPLAIGRSRANDVILEHPDIALRHAIIEQSATGLVLRDLGSSHGTRIAGRKLVEQRLDRSQSFQLGDIQVDVAIDPRARPAKDAVARRQKQQQAWLNQVVTLAFSALAIFGAQWSLEEIDARSSSWPGDAAWFTLASLSAIFLISMMLAGRRQRKAPRVSRNKFIAALTAASVMAQIWLARDVWSSALEMTSTTRSLFELSLSGIGFLMIMYLVSATLTASSRQLRALIAGVLFVLAHGAAHLYQARHDGPWPSVTGLSLGRWALPAVLDRATQSWDAIFEKPL